MQWLSTANLDVSKYNRNFFLYLFSAKKYKAKRKKVQKNKLPLQRQKTKPANHKGQAGI